MLSYHIGEKPCHVVPIGNDITEYDLDDLRDEMIETKNRIEKLKDYLPKLVKAGWIPFMNRYEILFDHKTIDNEKKSRESLLKINIDPDEFEFTDRM